MIGCIGKVEGKFPFAGDSGKYHQLIKLTSLRRHRRPSLPRRRQPPPPTSCVHFVIVILDDEDVDDEDDVDDVEVIRARNMSEDSFSRESR